MLDNLRKEYNNEVHKALLGSIKTKLKLKSYDNSVKIIYLLDVLTKDEKRKFNIKHLDYDEDDDLDETSEDN